MVNNYTIEEVLDYCVRGLNLKMTETNLGKDYIYWEILEELNKKVSGQSRVRVL